MVTKKKTYKCRHPNCVKSRKRFSSPVAVKHHREDEHGEPLSASYSKPGVVLRRKSVHRDIPVWIIEKIPTNRLVRELHRRLG